MANKLIILFDDTNAITSHIDPSLGVFRQGDVGHEIYCHFESFANYSYGAYIIFERADGSKSPELPMTLADFTYNETLYSGFKLVIDDEWIMAQDGALKATVRVRNASGTVVASGLVPISLEKTVYDESPDITVEQYNALLAMLESFITDDSILYPHVLREVPEDLTDILVGTILFVATVSGDVEVYKVIVRSGDKVLSLPFTINSSLIKETFSPTNYTPAAATAKGHFVGIDNLFDAIITGTQLVGKAVMDEGGHDIQESYGASLSTDNDDAALKIALRNKLNDVLTTLILREATTTKNGLMSSADKVKLTDLPTKGQLDSALAVKVPQTRKILGIDLVDDILLAEFKTAIGEATAILSGLMSATDKSRLDALHALLGVESDANDVVNTINEVLAIFNNYPEGADLVNALSGKVDRVEGKDLSENDFTDILKAKLDSLLSGDNYYDKTYIDALKDLNGWSSALLTETALTNDGVITKATLSDYDVIKLFVINTTTGEIDTDSFDTSIGLVDNYKYVFFDNDDIYLSIADPNCTFTDNIGGYQLKIIGQKYEAQDAENVNYDKTVKNLLEAENVQDAIDEIADEVLAPAFVEVEHLALQSEITATDTIEIKDDSGELVKITGNTLPSEDVDVLKAMGIKNDSGVLFSALTPEEITEQLDIWHEVGYPTHINKLISKSDNLFNGKFNTLTSLESENLISNSDLLIDSNADNIPDGFEYTNATDISLTNGIAKFTATARYGHIRQITPNVFNLVNGNTYYFYSKVKSTSEPYMLLSGVGVYISIVNDGNWQFTSKIFTASSNYSGTGVRINDDSTSDWTPIEVDYMGAINITDLVYRGILPSGLTNLQYKDMLDNAIYNNVPLRESDYISVEPSVSYRLIKASENSAIHKVIEYTTDNQVVKVNSVDYSSNVKISSPITMNALTRKVKLISDLMDRVPNLVSNSDFSGVISPWAGYYNASLSIENNALKVIKSTATNISTFRQPKQLNITTNDLFYFSLKIKTPETFAYFRLSSYYSGGEDFIQTPNYNVIPTDFTTFSHIGNFSSNITTTNLGISVFTNGAINSFYFVDNINVYNITDFIKKGVVDDNGTLFSRLTKNEIKAQMDIWVQNGFPDSVINALYPDGADTAISLKYNDGDAIYYPQVIDELPLDITLRSGEYWQDGYIVKQNGNAEASPLGKVFSAWNYGQIEAIYDSGVPADFKVKYAQNISAQVSTHSEYLKEARERLDTLRVNQKQLIKKLGIDVDNDVYDSFVGITSEKFEYYQLEGIKSGNILKVEGRGQSVANLLVNTIDPSITGFGLTITYDDTTGMFTVNGITTGAGNIILKTGMNFGLPVGTTCQLMRYFDSGTIDLNGSYCGYLISGTSVSNRINENSESLYDPYINGVGELKPDGANPNVDGSSGQSLVFQVYKAGMIFTDFKFKVALYEGTKLLPFAMPEATNNTDVDVYNRTANILDMGTSDIAYTAVSGITIGYNALAQEFVISGTATANNTITLKANVKDVISGDRVSIKRVFQSGDITAVSTLPTIELFDGTSVVLANSIYKMTAPEGETPTPDVSFNTGTIQSNGTLTLRLQFKDDDVFDNYRFRLMIHDKSTDIGYVAYNRTLVGSLTAEANETDSFEFSAIDFGILEFIPKTDKLNIIFGDTITDTDNSVLEYNAGIQSPNRKISVLEARMTALDNPFRDKVIAIWGDSRESNNPTSDPSGVGDQKDTSYPALLAKKLGATVLNFGLSGGAWAENTVQQDAASAIVNRVLTEDTSASADVIIISSMNDFKLATPLGSPTEATDKTTFYGAMRMTYKRLANKYPGKKIWLVLPQKRFDESNDYGGGNYLSYRKAQIDVAREYGIPTIDLYNNFPNSKTKITGGVSFYDTNMLNDTHFSAIGNDLVAEIITRSLLGNGNSGVVETLPALPTADGTYTLKLTVSNGVNTFSWISDNS
jgi:hypothetical protein